MKVILSLFAVFFLFVNVALAQNDQKPFKALGTASGAGLLAGILEFKNHQVKNALYKKGSFADIPLIKPHYGPKVAGPDWVNSEEQLDRVVKDLQKIEEGNYKVYASARTRVPRKWNSFEREMPKEEIQAWLKGYYYNKSHSEFMNYFDVTIVARKTPNKTMKLLSENTKLLKVAQVAMLGLTAVSLGDAFINWESGKNQKSVARMNSSRSIVVEKIVRTPARENSSVNMATKQ